MNAKRPAARSVQNQVWRWVMARPGSFLWRGASSKHQIPTSKFQRSSNIQACKFLLRAARHLLACDETGFWSLELGASLDFGCWSLDLSSSAPQPDQTTQRQYAAGHGGQQNPFESLELASRHHQRVFDHRTRSKTFEQL